MEKQRISLQNGISLDISIYRNENLQFYGGSNIISLLFLNSAFFNKNQWKKMITLLDSKIGLKSPIQYITYDYAGIGESTYKTHEIMIDDFILEYREILNHLKLDRVHIFATSIGTWIALHIYLRFPESVCSFTGYGILTSLISDFDTLRGDRFDRIKKSLPYLIAVKDEKINELNWNEILEKFYIPIFFNEFHQDALDAKMFRLKDMLSKIIFPIVSGNSIKMFIDYYRYIRERMLDEKIEILNMLPYSSKAIPVLLMNGKKDQITNSNMCEDLSKRIRHSETRYFDELGHGSMILGKGLKEIIDSYLDFLKKKGFLKIGQD